MHKFEENISAAVSVKAHIPGATAAVVGTGVSLAKYNNYALACTNTFIAANGCAVTYYIAQSTDNTTFSTSYLATCTLASNTTTNQNDVIEVRAEQLTDGYTYVAGVAACASTATQQTICAMGLRWNPRFA